MDNFGEKVSFIWSVADLLRGPYRPNQYKDIMLPLTLLRRLDCVLEPTKDKVLERMKKLEGGKVKNVDPIMCRVTGVPFYNTSRYTFEKLKGDPNNIAANLTNYIKGFSTRAREIIERFGFEEHIARLDKADRLFLIVSRFCQIDLHPDRVSNIEMGYIFEELIRRFNEASNEEAGDHFTPREVIRLMVNLLFMPDSDVLTTRGIVKTLYDPACGTGGMLSVAEDYVRELNPDAQLEVFGQDYNAQANAICGSDMMIKGQNIDHIAYGDSFTDDRFGQHTFDYMLANPPFGVEWKPEQDAVKREHEEQGFGGRFGAGLPRINDGSLLFLQHMISKMKAPKEGGTRLAIVFNGSPLFTGGAGSGESEIRRWIIENDWLEAIVALPDQLFYNTGIYTYLWIVTNRKEASRRGKIQLVDGTSFFKKMRKSLGNKRNEVCDEQRDDITRLYGMMNDEGGMMNGEDADTHHSSFSTPHFKDSGSEWLGEVPESWHHRKLGYVASMSGGCTPSKSNEEYWRGTIPWVSPKDMKKRCIADSEDHVSEDAVRETGLRLLEPPVVLVVVRGMILAHTFPVGLTTAPVTINQDMKALRPVRGVVADYLPFLLEGISSFVLSHVDEFAHGTKCLRTDMWRNISVLIPDEREQLEIFAQLHDQMRKIDALKRHVEASIATLQEHRVALISAAVTGKTDVRSEVA